MTGHLSDKQKQAALDTIARRQELVHLSDLEKLLKTDWGRRLLYHYVFIVGGLENGSFNMNIRDGADAALQCAFVEGRRAVAREMMLEAQKAHPERWIDVVAEATRARAADLEQVEKVTQSASHGEES